MTEINMAPRVTHLIELRLWRQFVMLAEELHFGRAAARLNMTQPPLTQAIVHLEELLGVKLFDRTKRSVQMTAAGLALLPDARDLLARATAMPALARAAAGGEIGRLSLGFVSTVGFLLLPKWVRAFRQRYPEITLDLVEATGDVQLQLLSSGKIDAGFMLHSPGFEPPELARMQIATEPLVLALPEQHPLAAAGKPAFGKVLAEPLVIFPRRIVPSLHDAVFGVYHAAGRLPQVVQEGIQMQTIVNLVSAGLGVAWVPASVQQFQRQGVVYKSVQVPKSLPKVPVCETSLVWKRSNINPTLARFVDFVTP